MGYQNTEKLMHPSLCNNTFSSRLGPKIKFLSNLYKVGIWQRMHLKIYVSEIQYYSHSIHVSYSIAYVYIHEKLQLVKMLVMEPECKKPCWRDRWEAST
jgi:hypothetical protein